MVCINKTMNTDKKNFQKWLVGNENITHTIHITPNKYSDTQMRKYLSWVNSELNKSIDDLYGKPYNEKGARDCDKYIYKLIPESKGEIDKLVKSGIY